MSRFHFFLCHLGFKKKGVELSGFCCLLIKMSGKFSFAISASKKTKLTCQDFFPEWAQAQGSLLVGGPLGLQPVAGLVVLVK